MILLADIGNTHCVWGWADDSLQLKATWRSSTFPLQTSDEIRLWIKSLLQEQELSWSSLHVVFISSVVPGWIPALKEAFEGKKVHVIHPRCPFSFEIEADPPEEVGSDRLVNAEGVVKHYALPAIVIDSGTATTLCAISSHQSYLGGAILPGIEISMDALFKKASKLSPVDLSQVPEKAIGSNTSEALLSGILFGYGSMIQGMIERFKAELTKKPLVIATGGVLPYLKPYLKDVDHFDPYLSFKGMLSLYAKNQPS